MTYMAGRGKPQTTKQRELGELQSRDVSIMATLVETHFREVPVAVVVRNE